MIHLLFSIKIKKDTPNNIPVDGNREILNISYSSFIRYGTICCLSLLFVANICSLISMIKLTTNLSPGLIHLAARIMWYFGRICLNSIFVSRLKHSFYDTPWSYSDNTFKYLYCSLLINVFIVISLIIITIIIIETRSILLLQIGVIFAICGSVLDVTISIVLTYLYQKKVYQLIKSYFITFKSIQKQKIEQRKEREEKEETEEKEEKEENTKTHSLVSISSVSSISKNINLHETEGKNIKNAKKIKNTKDIIYKLMISESVNMDDLNEHDIELVNYDETDQENRIMSTIYNDYKLDFIHTMTQYTVIICLSFVTSLFVISFLMIRNIWIQRNTKPTPIESAKYAFYLNFIINIDSFLNALCLFLHFPFSLNIYNALCHHKFCFHSIVIFCVSKLLY